MSKPLVGLNHKFDVVNRMDGKCYWCGLDQGADVHVQPPLTAMVVVAFTDWKVAVRYTRGKGLMPESATVVGLYKAPTQFCSCESGEGTGERNKVMGYTKGKRFGWWVHHTCGKPAVAWAKGFGVRLTQSFGFNLLPNPPFPFDDGVIKNVMDKNVGRRKWDIVPTPPKQYDDNHL